MFFPILTAVGLAVFLISYIMLVVAASRKDIWWGLGSVVPFVGLVFVYRNWTATKIAFFASLAGITMFAIGYQIAEGF